MGKIKAMVCEKYGSPNVLKYLDVEKPEPKENNYVK